MWCYSLTFDLLIKNGKVIDIEIVDIEEVENAIPEVTETSYKFKEDITPEELYY